MTWSEAYTRARRFATERHVRYVVFAAKLNGRWIYYSVPAGHAALDNARRPRR